MKKVIKIIVFLFLMFPSLLHAEGWWKDGWSAGRGEDFHRDDRAREVQRAGGTERAKVLEQTPYKDQIKKMGPYYKPFSPADESAESCPVSALNSYCITPEVIRKCIYAYCWEEGCKEGNICLSEKQEPSVDGAECKVLSQDCFEPEYPFDYKASKKLVKYELSHNGKPYTFIKGCPTGYKCVGEGECEETAGFAKLCDDKDEINTPALIKWNDPYSTIGKLDNSVRTKSYVETEGGIIFDQCKGVMLMEGVCVDGLFQKIGVDCKAILGEEIASVPDDLKCKYEYTIFTEPPEICKTDPDNELCDIIAGKVESGDSAYCYIPPQLIKDKDGDTVIDQLDNCVDTPNKDQLDTDKDGIGNACEILQLSEGQGNHTCALMNNSTVKCWGYNTFGQLGNGKLENSSLPVDVLGLKGVKAVTTGSYHTCALMNNATVKCWGEGSLGQIGNGSDKPYNSDPVEVSSLNNVETISAGYYHTCALLSSGFVKCWGGNGFGQLGDGTKLEQTEPIQVLKLKDVKAISAGGFHTCALLEDKTIRCWGRNEFYQLGTDEVQFFTGLETITAFENVKSISAGSMHTCALLNDGTINCWGANETGQLGIGNLSVKSLPVQVKNISDASDAKAISAGGAHACALINDGTVKCWGRNVYGPTNGIHHITPMPVGIYPLSNAQSISVGKNHACALTASNKIKCWGVNEFGQLGDGTTEEHISAVEVKVE